jgi:uncharacterized protein (DUF302 family)
MTQYAITRTIAVPFDDAVENTRTALAEQGFGVLTEIDVAATMKAKLDVDVPRQLILGACNPPLAHRAMQVEESIGVLLPCNVVVRAAGPATTIVEAIDPSFLVTATANPRLEPIAAEVSAKLHAVLTALGTA